MALSVGAFCIPPHIRPQRISKFGKALVFFLTCFSSSASVLENRNGRLGCGRGGPQRRRWLNLHLQGLVL